MRPRVSKSWSVDRVLVVFFSSFFLFFYVFRFFCYCRSSWRKPRWLERSGRIFVRRLPRADRADFASGLPLLLDGRHVFGLVSRRYDAAGTWSSTKITRKPDLKQPLGTKVLDFIRRPASAIRACLERNSCGTAISGHQALSVAMYLAFYRLS